MANSDSFVTLYYKVYSVLKDELFYRRSSQGEKFPTEKELVKEFGVSRITIRKALELLERDGLIKRMRGKGSTIVARPPDTRSVKLTGSIEDIIKTGVDTCIRVISFEVVEPPANIVQLFKGTDSQFLKIERVRYVNKSPFSFSIAYLPGSMGTKIKEETVAEKPILEILRTELKVPVTRGFQKIEAAVANPRVAMYLSVPTGFPLLKVERTMYDDNDKPVEYIVIFYRSDRYYYSVEFRLTG
ncbi:MAG: GntR family transcriptional regulator [Candidatus Bathyarchaeia archaeon]